MARVALVAQVVLVAIILLDCSPVALVFPVVVIS